MKLSLLFALTIVMLNAMRADAAPGDLCKALSQKPVELAKVQAAIDAGESVDTVCNNSPGSITSAFRLAVPYPDVAIYLIRKGVSPDFVNTRTGWHHKISSFTNFTLAATDGTLDEVREFLARKPDLKALGGAALFGAFNRKKFDVAQLLLDSGVNPYVPYSALFLAIYNHAPLEMTMRIIDGWNFQTDPNDITNVYLHLAAQIGSLEVIQRLVALGANPHSIYDSERKTKLNALTIFVLASHYGDTPENKAIFDYLVALGLDVNENDSMAFMYSVRLRYYSWVALALINAGANPNVIFHNYRWSNTDMAPLMLAIGGGTKVEVVRSLIDHGADVNYRNNNETTPLCLAMSPADGIAWYPENALELINRGADVNALCWGGESVLCLSQGNQFYKDVTAALIARGAKAVNCRQH